MANEIEHIQQAVHNMRVTAYLYKEPPFCDWTTTLVFYSAVHIAEAVFFNNLTTRQHATTHDEREGFLKENNRYLNITEHYIPLKRMSLKARYLVGIATGTTFAEYMPANQVMDRLIKGHLAQIIKTATKFLSSKSARLLKSEFQEIF